MNKNSVFICFNEKIKKICSDMTDINIVYDNDSILINSLNSKFKSRNLVKNIVPVLDYYMVDSEHLSYDNIVKNIKSNKFVVQAENGSGGNTTYLISNSSDLDSIPIGNFSYCVSQYINHVPLNVTIIIGDKDIIYLPISIQLILVTNNKFKYVGGDFFGVQNLSKKSKNKIKLYSKNIAEKLKNIGYRGVLGIDFILCNNDEIFFMEINPRFQSSSFLISMELERIYSTCIGEMHYQAITGKKIQNVIIEKIDKSFVNCNSVEKFDNLNNYELITKGYFKDNITSNYRKVFDRSILNEDNFEKIIYD